MSGLRLPLRLARREVRRRPGRTLLVAILVALPVAGMALAATVIRTDHTTPAQEWEQRFGRADARSDGTPTGLPEGTRTLEVREGYARVKTVDGRRSDTFFSDLPLQDPMTSGIFQLVGGRPPTAAGEVVLTTKLRQNLGATVGEELVLERPAITLRVVGEVERPSCLSCTEALFAPGRLPAATDVSFGAQRALHDLPRDLTLQEAFDLQQAVGDVELRQLALLPGGFYDLDDDGGEGVRWSLVLGAVVLTVAGIVISAAFAVGARRQLVTLGQLSASGASPATVRAALVLQGTVTGLVGVAMGFVLAAVLLLIGQSLVEQVLDQRVDGYSVRPLDMALVGLIGTLAATVAALIPARTAAGIPTLAALAGRRPLAPVSRRLVAWGLVSFVGGLGLLTLAVLGARSRSSVDVWAYVAILGAVAELLGACALAPALVARLEPLAQRLRGSLRLGARSLARHRARTGAVVSAVAAAGALAVTAGGLVLGQEAANGIEVGVPSDVVVARHAEWDDRTGAEVRSGPPVGAAAADLDDLFDGAATATVRATGSRTPSPTGDEPWFSIAPAPGRSGAATVPGGFVPPGGGAQDQLFFGLPSAVVGDPAVLEAIQADRAVREALDDTGFVLLTPSAEGQIEVTLPDGRAVPGRAVSHPFVLGWQGRLLVSEARADALSIDLVDSATLYHLPGPITAEQRDGIEDIWFDGSADTAQLDIQWATPNPFGPTPAQLELLLAGVALALSLFVVGVSLALAAAESKDERDVLTIAGAPPGTLARSAGARAWLLAVIGGLMAVPVGFLPVVVFTYASGIRVFGESPPLVFPTRTVLLLVLVVPAIVALAAWAASASAQRLRPVRVSTAVFE